MYFLEWNDRIPIQISLKFVSRTVLLPTNAFYSCNISIIMVRFWNIKLETRSVDFYYIFTCGIQRRGLGLNPSYGFWLIRRRMLHNSQARENICCGTDLEVIDCPIAGFCGSQTWSSLFRQMTQCEWCWTVSRHSFDSKVNIISSKNLTVTASVDGSTPVLCQAISLPNVDLFSIGPSWTHLSEMLFEIQTLPFMKVHLKW